MLGQNYFIRKAIARRPLALHHSHDVTEQSVLTAILASNELPVMAISYRPVHVRGTSGVPPASDLRARMSGIVLFSSGLPLGPEVPRSVSDRGVMPHSGRFDPGHGGSIPGPLRVLPSTTEAGGLYECGVDLVLLLQSRLRPKRRSAHGHHFGFKNQSWLAGITGRSLG